MKKTLIAILVGASTVSMTANADVFIDEQAQAEARVVAKVEKPVAKAVQAVKTMSGADIQIEKVAVKPQVAPVKKAEPKQVEKPKMKVKAEAPKELKMRNVVKKVDLKQEISTFEHIGAKKETAKLQGFSNDVQLRQALEQLVPEDWAINVSNKVNLDKKVSFAGGKTWNDTLENVGKDNFSATFDWNSKSLIIVPTELKHKSETVATTEDLGAVKAVKKAVKKPAKKIVKATNTANVKKAVKEKSWVLSKNYTLKQNIEMWGKRAGWTVAWNAPDYAVVANTTLTGEIDSENGPIISILKLYEDSALPLKVSIMGGNKVISVESRNYVPRDAIDIGNQ